MRLFKRGDTWYCSFWQNGVRIKKTTQCTDKRAAEAIAREYERAASDPAYAASTTQTVNRAVGLMIEHATSQQKAGKIAGGTLNMYQVKGGHLVRLLGNYLLASITRGTVNDYIKQRRIETASESTIHKELVTLRVALRLAREHGLWTGLVDDVVPAFDAAYKPRERWLTPDELARLLRHLEPDRAARVAWIVATASRWAETEHALRGDYNTRLQSVTIRGTKTDQSHREIPIVGVFRQLIEFAIKHAEGKEGKMFAQWTSPQLTLRRACRDAQIKYCTPNDLRRTTASWLIQAGVSNTITARILGHSTTKMVDMVYGQVTVESLRESLNRSIRGWDTGGTVTRETAGIVGPNAPRESNSTAEIVPRAGIEPATQGFSVLCLLVVGPRKTQRIMKHQAALGTPVGRKKVKR